MIKKKLNAFSLLEVGLVLLIVGVISSALLPFLTQYHASFIKKDIEYKQQYIAKSLAAYVLQNRCLPTASLPSHNGHSIPQQHVGIVPYQELNIDSKMAKDKKGFWFTYAVNQPLTETCIKHKNEEDLLKNTDFCTVSLAQQHIQIHQHPCHNDGIGFILIAHHEGNGAFNKDDQRFFIQKKQTPQTSFEQQNALSTRTFFADNVRDVVFWISRYNFMIQIAQKPCHQLLPSHTSANKQSLPDTFDEF